MTLQDQLDSVQTEINRIILKPVSVSILGRTVTNQSLPALYERERLLMARIAKSSRSGTMKSVTLRTSM